MGLIRRGFGGAVRFVWSLRGYFIVALSIFIAGTSLAWVTVARNPQLAQDAVGAIGQLFEAKNLYEQVPPEETDPGGPPPAEPEDGWEDWEFDDAGPPDPDQEPEMNLRIKAPRLIWNNLVAMFFCVLLGFIPFLFVPALPLFFNAVIVGMLGGALSLTGMSVGSFLLFLAPHGIFEIPCILLSCAMGFYLSLGLARMIIRSPKAQPFGKVMKEVSRTFLLLIIPLTALAGILETYVTPLLMDWMLGG